MRTSILVGALVLFAGACAASIGVADQVSEHERGPTKAEAVLATSASEVVVCPARLPDLVGTLEPSFVVTCGPCHRCSMPVSTHAKAGAHAPVAHTSGGMPG